MPYKGRTWQEGREKEARGARLAEPTPGGQFRGPPRADPKTTG